MLASQVSKLSQLRHVLHAFRDYFEAKHVRKGNDRFDDRPVLLPLIDMRYELTRDLESVSAQVREIAER